MCVFTKQQLQQFAQHQERQIKCFKAFSYILEPIYKECQLLCVGTTLALATNSTNKPYTRGYSDHKSSIDVKCSKAEAKSQRTNNDTLTEKSNTWKIAKCWVKRPVQNNIFQFEFHNKAYQISMKFHDTDKADNVFSTYKLVRVTSTNKHHLQ